MQILPPAPSVKRSLTDNACPVRKLWAAGGKADTLIVGWVSGQLYSTSCSSLITVQAQHRCAVGKGDGAAFALGQAA